MLKLLFARPLKVLSLSLSFSSCSTLFNTKRKPNHNDIWQRIFHASRALILQQLVVVVVVVVVCLSVYLFPSAFECLFLFLFLFLSLVDSFARSFVRLFARSLSRAVRFCALSVRLLTCFKRGNANDRCSTTPHLSACS